MSVIDRRNRARSHSALRQTNDADSRVVSFAMGIVQHHHDDRWFHQTEAFSLLSARFAVELRSLVQDSSGHQAGFVGHIVVELLLDSVLSDDNPEYLIGYYKALESLDLQFLQDTANRICSKPFDALTRLVPRFVEERFLADYSVDDRLWLRLNHVMLRVGFQPLPKAVIEWLATARPRVRQSAQELLQEPGQVSRLNLNNNLPNFDQP
jgi:hypothetical protein